MIERDAFYHAGYRPDHLIDDQTLAAADVPKTLPGIAEIKRWSHTEVDGATTRQLTLTMPSCGGVSIDYSQINESVVADRAGSLGHLSSIVTATRPKRTSLFWDTVPR